MKTPRGAGNGERAKRKRGHDGSDGQEDTTYTGKRVGDAPASVDERIQSDPQSKRKWTRLLLRELYDLGFAQAAECLEREASVRVRSSAMETLQALVLAHRWDDALAFLKQHEETTESTGDALQMKSRAAAKEVMLLLLKRKYVELLLHKQLRDALETFQQQILPVFDLMEKLVSLPLKDAALLDRIEALVSPDEVVPHGCLRQMVHWDDSTAKQVASFSHAESVETECIALLLKHTHEVLDLAFSPNGKYLASVAQDGKIIIWEFAFTQREDEKTGDPVVELGAKTLHVLECIDGAPTCMAWSPDSRALLSGGGDESNVIQLWNPLTGRQSRRFQHPAESVASICWLPDGNHFLSGSVEKSLVMWNVDDASIAYQWGGRRALDIAIHPKGDQVFVLCSETELRVYNVVDKSDRLLLRADHLIASITVSATGDFILLSLIEHEEIACFDISADTIVSRQRGFRQERFVLRPCFAGAENELVVSGSEDGSIHVWLREDGRAVGEASAHSSVVNVVAVHPTHRNIVASASDDETIRVWRLSA